LVCLFLIYICSYISSNSLELPDSYIVNTNDPVSPVTKKVYVLEFNPIIESRNNQRLNNVYGWSDPLNLEYQYIQDVSSVSAYLNYQIVNRTIIDGYPVKTDGFQYTDESYQSCWEGKTCHIPDSMDYEKILSDYNICEMLNSGQIDELWLWGGPYFGFNEAAMAGPGAFNINGGVFINNSCNRKLPIMGFNYERSIPEMLENMGHRFEATMSKLFLYWTISENRTVWDQYGHNLGQTPNVNFYGCGSVHYAPNSLYDYQWSSNTEVFSNCNDWYNYPNFSGLIEKINCQTWGCNAYGHKKWWLSHLPKYPGVKDSKYNNWWRYIADWDEAMLTLPTPSPDPNSHRDGLTWCSNHGGIFTSVPYDVNSWTGCLNWCDSIMNYDKPICQYNADSPRNCWVNYAPGGQDGNVNNCNWLKGVPPFGAWYIEYEPIQSPEPTPMANDINGDGLINLDDLIYLLMHWGKKSEYNISMLISILNGL